MKYLASIVILLGMLNVGCAAQQTAAPTAAPRAAAI